MMARLRRYAAEALFGAACVLLGFMIAGGAALLTLAGI